MFGMELFWFVYECHSGYLPLNAVFLIGFRNPIAYSNLHVVTLKFAKVFI